MPMKPKPKSSLGEKALITVLCFIMALSLFCVAGIYLLKTRFLANHPDGGEPRASGVTASAGIFSRAVTIDMDGLAAAIGQGLFGN